MAGLLLKSFPGGLPGQLQSQLLPGMPVLEQAQCLENHWQEEREQRHRHVHRVAAKPIVMLGQVLGAAE